MSLELTYQRGNGYVFRAIPFFDRGDLGREYHIHIGGKLVRIFFDCKRQSKKRYEESKKVVFDYVYSDAGKLALNDAGIVLLGKVNEREWDCYA